MGFTDRAAVGIVLALLFGVAVCPATGVAENVEAILKKGNDLRRRGRDREALAEFQRAAQISDTARVTAQIALAEQAVGLWVEAETHMTKALADPRDPWIAKNRPTLEGALRTVREHVGTIEVWGAPDGAEVLFDGKPAGHLPVGPISFASDEVAAQIRAPGYAETSRTIRVRMGAAVREHVELRRVPPPAPTVALAPEPVPKPSVPAPPNGLQTEGAPDVSTAASSTRTPLILGTAGLAAAALGFGIVEHLAWRKKVDSFGTMTGCDADLSDRGGPTCGQLYDDGNGARTLTFVGYGVAGALAATSVILYVTRPTASSLNGAHVACAIAPSPAGFDCAVRF